MLLLRHRVVVLQVLLLLQLIGGIPMNRQELKQMIKDLGRTMRNLPLTTPEEVAEHRMIQEKYNDLLEIYYI